MSHGVKKQPKQKPIKASLETDESINVGTSNSNSNVVVDHPPKKNENVLEVLFKNNTGGGGVDETITKDSSDRISEDLVVSFSLENSAEKTTPIQKRRNASGNSDPIASTTTMNHSTSISTSGSEIITEKPTVSSEKPSTVSSEKPSVSSEKSTVSETKQTTQTNKVVESFLSKLSMKKRLLGEGSSPSVMSEPKLSSSDKERQSAKKMKKSNSENTIGSTIIKKSKSKKKKKGKEKEKEKGKEKEKEKGKGKEKKEENKDGRRRKQYESNTFTYADSYTSYPNALSSSFEAAQVEEPDPMLKTPKKRVRKSKDRRSLQIFFTPSSTAASTHSPPINIRDKPLTKMSIVVEIVEDKRKGCVYIRLPMVLDSFPDYTPSSSENNSPLIFQKSSTTPPTIFIQEYSRNRTEKVSDWMNSAKLTEIEIVSHEGYTMNINSTHEKTWSNAKYLILKKRIYDVVLRKVKAKDTVKPSDYDPLLCDRDSEEERTSSRSNNSNGSSPVRTNEVLYELLELERKRTEELEKQVKWLMSRMMSETDSANTSVTREHSTVSVGSNTNNNSDTHSVRDELLKEDGINDKSDDLHPDNIDLLTLCNEMFDDTSDRAKAKDQRRLKLRNFGASISGFDIICWLEERFKLKNRTDAIPIAQKLLDSGHIRTSKTNSEFEDSVKSLYYRVIEQRSRNRRLTISFPVAPTPPLDEPDNISPINKNRKKKKSKLKRDSTKSLSSTPSFGTTVGPATTSAIGGPGVKALGLNFEAKRSIFLSPRSIRRTDDKIEYFGTSSPNLLLSFSPRKEQNSSPSNSGIVSRRNLLIKSKSSAKDINQNAEIQKQKDTADKLKIMLIKKKELEKQRKQDEDKYKEMNETDKKAWRKHKSEEELISSEREFLEDMEFVYQHFYLPLFQSASNQNKNNNNNNSKPILALSDVETIFRDLEQVVEASTKLLLSLENCFVTNTCLGDAFSSNSDELQIYESVCVGHKASHDALKRTSLSQGFHSWIKSREAVPECRGLDLESFLIKPFQRATKYPLLISTIMKETETGDPSFPGLEKALLLTREIITKANETKKIVDQVDKLVELQNSMEFPTTGPNVNPIDFIDGTREYVFGQVFWTWYSGTDKWNWRSITLLSDAVVFAFKKDKPEKQNNNKLLIFEELWNLEELLVWEEPKTVNGKPGFGLSIGGVLKNSLEFKYVMEVDSVHMATKWINLLKHRIRKQMMKL